MEQIVHGYSGATQHYLSPQRRDAVKTLWEEPFSRAVLGRAIRWTRHEGRAPLRVLDVGCGTGDGWSLIAGSANTNGGVEYVGLDICPEMIEVARTLHSHTRGVAFLEEDCRERVPPEPFDLYLSTGVPYSHLTHLELQQTLCKIFSCIRLNRTRSVVVTDVLGRFSIEWVSMWDRSRWPYRMSFFLTNEEAKPTLMSFYSAKHLQDIIQRAATQARCQLLGIEFFDRSIMVGKHTTTGEYNPGLPRYRGLVNSLIAPDRTTDLAQLLFQVELGPTSKEVSDFFRRFAAGWDGLVREAMAFCGQPIDGARVILPHDVRGMSAELQRLRATNRLREDFRASVVEPMLAEYLRRLEVTTQPGFGVGHSLIAVVYLDESEREGRSK